MKKESAGIPLNPGPDYLARVEIEMTSGRQCSAVPKKSEPTIGQNGLNSDRYNIAGAQFVSGNDIEQLEISADGIGHTPLEG